MGHAPRGGIMVEIEVRDKRKDKFVEAARFILEHGGFFYNR